MKMVKVALALLFAGIIIVIMSFFGCLPTFNNTENTSVSQTNKFCKQKNVWTVSNNEEILEAINANAKYITVYKSIRFSDYKKETHKRLFAESGYDLIAEGDCEDIYKKKESTIL